MRMAKRAFGWRAKNKREDAAAELMEATKNAGAFDPLKDED
jgi:hypothetical protein